MSTPENALAQSKKPTLLDLLQKAEIAEDTLGCVPDELLEEMKAEVLIALGDTVEKVDGYAARIVWHMKRASCATGELGNKPKKDLPASGLLAEVHRLEKRIKREEGSADRLRHLALFAIRVMSPNPDKLRKLEGTHCTLKAVKVPDSCEVYDEAAVPDEYKPGTVEMPLELWEAARGIMAEFRRILVTEEMPNPREDVDAAVNGLDTLLSQHVKLTRTVDKKTLLAALKEKCEECKGAKQVPKELDEIVEEDGGAGVEPYRVCPKCNGKGTQLIPGARLETGKLRLVIE